MGKGTILSVNLSAKKGEKKISVGMTMITMTGLEDDAHSGDWHRQVSLLSSESIEKMLQHYKELHLVLYEYQAFHLDLA